MINYSPFTKEVPEIDEQELKRLIDNSISEGWYIEYKSDFPKRAGVIEGNKIVKAISAFANTKGGWLLFGVDSNDKNIAINLCGIDLQQYNNISDQISQIIAANINPTPVYHFKIVELQSGKSVFLIKIEESPTPPYITSQGIIYQRENNESNPIKDRYIIEKLKEKSDNYYEAIDRFCSLDYGQTVGQSESKLSYLELYLFPLPYNSFHFKKYFTSDFFKKVAQIFYQNVDCIFQYEGEKDISIPLNLGFNSIYSSQNSLIIRPLTDKNLAYKTTTCELFINGSLKLLIPLPEFELANVPDYYQNSEVIEYLRDTYSPNETVQVMSSYYPIKSSQKPGLVTRRKQTDFVEHIGMIDGTGLIYRMLIIISKYRAILEDGNFDFNTEIGYRAKITNTFRKFVFLDSPDYIEKLKLYNLPIAPKNSLEVPRFLKGNYYTIDMKKQSSFLTIAMEILEAIGLPDSETIPIHDIMKAGLKRFDVKI